jgi:hypothetical protein
VSQSSGYGERLPPREDWLERRVRALEQQVRELQAARKEQSSWTGAVFKYYESEFHYYGAAIVQHEGRHRWYDGDGVVRRAIGEVDNSGGIEAGRHGDYVFDEYGALALGVDDGNRGIAYPGMCPTISDGARGKTLTNTSFEATYRFRFERPAGEVFLLGLPAQTNGFGVTGQARLREAFSGDVTSNVTIGEGAGWLRFAWLHPAECGWGDSRAADRPASMAIDLEVRLSSGAGSGEVWIWDPEIAMLGSRLMFSDAATNGNPSWE